MACKSVPVLTNPFLQHTATAVKIFFTKNVFFCFFFLKVYLSRKKEVTI
uniref:Uncharacterized protein n=1 Tax=Myoviridae sp. ctwVB15 TaxID=2825208 RepID=A0A8S5UNH3_9CAUD|nr:MAG TPA: hypothetical protein [Myoviridae sp. ctwVB15]